MCKADPADYHGAMCRSRAHRSGDQPILHGTGKPYAGVALRLADQRTDGAEGGADRFGDGRRAGRRLRRRILQLCGRDAGDV